MLYSVFIVYVYLFVKKIKIGMFLWALCMIQVVKELMHAPHGYEVHNKSTVCI